MQTNDELSNFHISISEMIQNRLDELEVKCNHHYGCLKFAETSDLKMEQVRILTPIYNEMNAWDIIKKQVLENEKQQRDDLEEISKYATEIVSECIELVEHILLAVNARYIPTDLFEKLRMFQENYKK